MKTKYFRFTRNAALGPKIVSLLTPKKLNIALGAPLVFAAAFSAPAVAGSQTVRLNGWASVGGECEATFTRNPAVIKNVDNIYIKVFGPIGTVPDPGRWYIDSPTLSMANSLGFGVSSQISLAETNTTNPTRSFITVLSARVLGRWYSLI